MTQFDEVYKEVVDYLMPLQTMYEHAVYHVLLRKSWADGRNEVRIGQRTLAKMTPLPAKVGTTLKGTEITRSSQAQIKKALEALANKGHIELGDTTFDGTLYRVKLPREIPECAARINEWEALQAAPAIVGDFYNVPENRRKVFERDGYQCRYCGSAVTPDSATLDHIKPVSEGGTHSIDNLVTCCLKCNSIKSARKPDETLLDLLDRFKQVIRQEDT
jgi:hypothetical protein